MSNDIEKILDNMSKETSEISDTLLEINNNLCLYGDSILENFSMLLMLLTVMGIISACVLLAIFLRNYK